MEGRMKTEEALKKQWKIIYPKGTNGDNQYIMPNNWKCSCCKTVCNCYVVDVILDFYGYDEVKLGHRFVRLHNDTFNRQPKEEK